MNRHFPLDFKASYWPEPRLGKRETRSAVIRRLHPPARRIVQPLTVAQALAALASKAEKGA